MRHFSKMALARALGGSALSGGGDGIATGAIAAVLTISGVSGNGIEYLASLIEGTESALFNPNDLEFSMKNTAGTSSALSDAYNDGAVLNNTAADNVGFVLNLADIGGSDFTGWIATQTNLIGTNPTLASSVTGWQAEGSATLSWSSGESAGELNITGASGGISDNQSITLTENDLYLFEVECKLGTYTGDMHLYLDGSSSEVISPNSSTYTKYRRVFRATAAMVDYTVRLTRADATTGTIFFRNFRITKLKEQNAHQETNVDKPNATEGLTFTGSNTEFLRMVWQTNPPPADVSIVMAVKTTDTDFTLVGSVAGDRVAAGISGSSSTDLGADVDVDGTTYQDGVDTRGDLYTAIADGSWHTVSILNLNMSAWDVRTYIAAFSGIATAEYLTGAIAFAAFLNNDNITNDAAVLAVAQDVCDAIIADL